MGRPHGTGGEVRATPSGPTLATLRPSEHVVLGGDGRPEISAVLTAIRPSDRVLLLRFQGVATRDAAAALTGAAIRVPHERLAALTEPDEFYVRDLVGCAVREGAEPLGTVADVHHGTANDALVVATTAGGEILVPFTRDAIVAMDVPGRTIHIRADLLGEVRP